MSIAVTVDNNSFNIIGDGTGDCTFIGDQIPHRSGYFHLQENWPQPGQPYWDNKITWPPQITPGSGRSGPELKEIIDKIREYWDESEESKKDKEQPMKTLFEVIIVSKKEEILLDTKVIAEDEDEAKFVADAATVMKEKDLKPKDVTIVVVDLGEVKVEKEPEQVRIVKD